MTAPHAIAHSVVHNVIFQREIPVLDFQPHVYNSRVFTSRCAKCSLLIVRKTCEFLHMSHALAHCDMAPERDVDAAVDKTAASGDDASDCTTRPLGFWHSDKVCTRAPCRHCPYPATRAAVVARGN